LHSADEMAELGLPGLNCASGEERHWTRRAHGTREEIPGRTGGKSTAAD
jgi:hypothetical protein